MRRCWHAIAGLRHDDVLEMLVVAYGEPQRRYHTALHVMWVLRHVEELLAAHPLPPGKADAVRAAALFHDVVYDPRSPTNEHDSARWAVRHLAELDWPPERVTLVAELIEATAAHVTPPAIASRSADDVSAASVLLDADLAVLGAEPAAYQAYVTGVRAEYGFVDDTSWRTGRTSVLRSFLGRDHIYATPTMRAQREHRARANLTAELAALRA